MVFLRVKTNFIRLGFILVKVWVITFMVNSVDGLGFDLAFLDDADQRRNYAFVED